MVLDSEFLIFAFSTAIILLTPGPTNTLLAAAGLAQGVKRALPLVGYELAGYLIAITAWGVFLASAQQHVPWLGTLVRVASSCYLALIAVKMWRAARSLPGSEQRPIGPRALFFATLLNPKGLVFASATFPARAFDGLPVYLVSTALFACLLLPIGLVWIRFGAALAGGRLWNLSAFTLQRAAALVIGLFSASIAWATFH